MSLDVILSLANDIFECGVSLTATILFSFFAFTHTHTNQYPFPLRLLRSVTVRTAMIWSALSLTLRFVLLNRPSKKSAVFSASRGLVFVPSSKQKFNQFSCVSFLVFVLFFKKTQFRSPAWDKEAQDIHEHLWLLLKSYESYFLSPRSFGLMFVLCAFLLGAKKQSSRGGGRSRVGF